MNEKAKIITISMQPDQHQKLKQLATIKGETLSKFIINSTLKRNENE